jgi:ribosome-associated protein
VGRRGKREEKIMKSEQIHHVGIARFPISLGQFLKLAGVADSGSAAKELLGQGEVLVNGVAVRERGKKLWASDTVTVREVFRLRAQEEEPSQTS